jgi:hypothetical protein
MRVTALALASLLLLLATGCTGIPLRLPSAPVGVDEEAIGPVSGEATGMMLFQLIPIGQNERFVLAYDRALDNAKGATRLVDVTIQEDWFWAWILNGYRFRVTGTAVRAKAGSE